MKPALRFRSHCSLCVLYVFPVLKYTICNRHFFNFIFFSCSSPHVHTYTHVLGLCCARFQNASMFLYLCPCCPVWRWSTIPRTSTLIPCPYPYTNECCLLCFHSYKCKVCLTMLQPNIHPSFYL